MLPPLAGVVVIDGQRTARSPGMRDRHERRARRYVAGPERRTIADSERNPSEAGFASSRSPTSRWSRPGPIARLGGAQ
jgi:hypothetical protein